MPKDEGRLGLHNLSSWNSVLLAKVLWKIQDEKESMRSISKALIPGDGYRHRKIRCCSKSYLLYETCLRIVLGRSQKLIFGNVLFKQEGHLLLMSEFDRKSIGNFGISSFGSLLFHQSSPSTFGLPFKAG